MERTTPRFRAPAWLWPGFLFVLTFGTACFAQAPITNGLVARWPGDGNARDSAGHAEGAVSGGLRYGPGPTGQAFLFDGGAARVDFGSSAGNFGRRDFSIACWMKTTAPSEEAFLGKRSVCAGGNWWNIRVGLGSPHIRMPGIVDFEMDDNTSDGHISLDTTIPLNDGAWHHLVWERQSTSSGSITYLVYVDGMLNNTLSANFAADLQNTTPLVLGQNICQGSDDTQPFVGSAAELQIFSHALSAGEISTLYKAGKPGK